MKKYISLSVVLGMALIFNGCAGSHPAGFIITDVKLPVQATSNNGSYSKTGEASCKSILAIVASGDCSIETAKKNGGITKVHHVDWHAKDTLGFGTFKVVVYGD
jgi:hypothetical protein